MLFDEPNKTQETIAAEGGHHQVHPPEARTESGHVGGGREMREASAGFPEHRVSQPGVGVSHQADELLDAFGKPLARSVHLGKHREYETHRGEYGQMATQRQYLEQQRVPEEDYGDRRRRLGLRDYSHSY